MSIFDFLKTKQSDCRLFEILDTLQMIPSYLSPGILEKKLSQRVFLLVFERFESFHHLLFCLSSSRPTLGKIFSKVCGFVWTSVILCWKLSRFFSRSLFGNEFQICCLQNFTPSSPGSHGTLDLTKIDSKQLIAHLLKDNENPETIE